MSTLANEEGRSWLYNPGMREPLGFTMFPSYVKVMEQLPDEETQWEFVKAVIGYGAYGNFPDLEFPLSAMFEAILPNLDSSRSAALRVRKKAEKKGEKEGSES